jgi:hypothetical protein
MNQNVGITDRIVRLVMAAIFAILYFTNVVSGTLGIVLLVLAVIFALTAAFGICPIYLALKFSTKSN